MSGLTWETEHVTGWRGSERLAGSTGLAYDPFDTQTPIGWA